MFSKFIMGRARKSKEVKPLGESNSDVSPSEIETKPKQPLQYNYWAFTFFNYLEQENNIKSWLIENCKKAVYGHEICPDTGRPHLQGYFNLKKKKRLTEIQNKPLTWSYLDPCYATDYANNKYCTKDGDDIFNHPFKRKPVKIITNLRPFQHSLLEMIGREPNDRLITWIYDGQGSSGKTQFCKYLIEKNNACYITSGKKSDIINMVYNYIQNKDLELVILNIPRDERRIDYIALEEIKDGIISNTKYETGTILTNSPHLLIFSNILPDTSRMTNDRWNIFTIDNNYELIPYQEGIGQV